MANEVVPVMPLKAELSVSAKDVLNVMLALPTLNVLPSSTVVPAAVMTAVPPLKVPGEPLAGLVPKVKPPLKCSAELEPPLMMPDVVTAAAAVIVTGPLPAVSVPPGTARVAMAAVAMFVVPEPSVIVPPPTLTDPVNVTVWVSAAMLMAPLVRDVVLVTVIAPVPPVNVEPPETDRVLPSVLREAEPRLSVEPPLSATAPFRLMLRPLAMFAVPPVSVVAPEIVSWVLLVPQLNVPPLTASD